MRKIKEELCEVGDYVEVATGPLDGGSSLMRGIVLEIEQQPRLWTSYCIYLFERYEKKWFYSYELTVISPVLLDNYAKKHYND